LLGLSPPVLVKLANLLARQKLFRSPLQVTSHLVPINDLPVELEGFTIAHVSDLHVGDERWGPIQASAAAQAVQAAVPDVVANTGDFLQWDPPVEKAVRVMEKFVIAPSPLLQGPANIAVLGNHDYYAGEEAVAELTRHLERITVEVIVNRSICLQFREREVSFIGLTHDAPGFEEGVRQLLEASRPRIVLIHWPDDICLIPEGAADLVLAGHTHGGQITLPFLTRYITRKFAKSAFGSGWCRMRGMPMYISRGLGCTGLPFRFRARPEVAFLRLTR
jgi:predicted MPP superfamily phosphohydrolase